jgi:hypothetical protein
LIIILWGCVVHAQLSGTARLDILAFPIPCTVIDIIRQDTPCEQTLLKFDIESILNLNLTISGMVFSINSAIGIAGPEHFIVTGVANLGAATVRAEMWFAVPFETQPDPNGMANIIVIQPGDELFVKKRLTTIINLGGVTIENLAMFEDVTFPNPGQNFPGLLYPAQSQSIGF